MAGNRDKTGNRHARTVLDIAAGKAKGVTLPCDTKGAAFQFRNRMYSVRYHDREQSKKLLAPTDPGYGRSPYDHLVLDIVENKLTGKWDIVIRPDLAALDGMVIVDNETGEKI
jgi:hypothetical protein